MFKFKIIKIRAVLVDNLLLVWENLKLEIWNSFKT